MKKALPILFMIFALISTVYAAAPLLELNPGQNVTINMEEFSRQTIRIFEGSSIDLNIQNELGDIPLTILVQEINADGNTHISVGQRGRTLQPALLTLGGNATQIRLDHKKIKAVFLEEKVLHYDTNPKERNIQLFINVPLFSAYTGELPYDSDTNKQPTEQPAPPTEKDSYIPYFLTAIIILILALLFLKPKKAGKKK